MEQLTKSNGATKRGMLRQPEVKPIVLYRREELPVCQDRLARVISGHDSLYASWHSFIKMRRDFHAEFKRSMPGATDIYDKQVRAEFNLNELADTTTPKQITWIFRRLPLDIPMPLRRLTLYCLPID